MATLQLVILSHPKLEPSHRTARIKVWNKLPTTFFRQMRSFDHCEISGSPGFSLKVQAPRLSEPSWLHLPSYPWKPTPWPFGHIDIKILTVQKHQKPSLPRMPNLPLRPYHIFETPCRYVTGTAGRGRSWFVPMMVEGVFPLNWDMPTYHRGLAPHPKRFRLHGICCIPLLRSSTFRPCTLIHKLT